ncbi:ATP-dependent DNA helicase RecG [Sodalis praecaptivus]
MTEGRLLNAIPLNTLSGIGPSLVSKFARLGLESLQDLLLHLPARYEDRTKLYPIGEALPGMTVTVQGEVLNSDISFGRKRMLTCRLRDDSGVLTLRFFHFNAAMKNSLSPANG